MNGESRIKNKRKAQKKLRKTHKRFFDKFQKSNYFSLVKNTKKVGDWHKKTQNRQKRIKIIKFIINLNKVRYTKKISKKIKLK